MQAGTDGRAGAKRVVTVLPHIETQQRHLYSRGLESLAADLITSHSNFPYSPGFQSARPIPPRNLQGCYCYLGLAPPRPLTPRSMHADANAQRTETVNADARESTAEANSQRGNMPRGEQCL
jgi:hypothetical protein